MQAAAPFWDALGLVANTLENGETPKITEQCAFLQGPRKRIPEDLDGNCAPDLIWETTARDK